MMTDAEVATIDNWRFANRVMTRSDAIRRLALRDGPQPAPPVVPAPTLRDRFAMQALNGIIDDCGLSAEEMAARCYEVADAMLAHRDKSASDPVAA